MKRILLLAFAAMALFTQLSAQSRGNDARKSSSSGLAQHLWYGGGFVLGFAGNSYSSQFQFGLSPMVGYKFTNILSVGPKGSIVYNHIRVQDFGGGVEKVNAWDYSAGVFARALIFRGFFGQVEYDYESYVQLYTDLTTVRVNRGNTYLGAGYNTSRGEGGFGTEIMVTYNLNQPGNTLESPFDYRIGFTFNF
jgi:hypothetical protein